MFHHIYICVSIYTAHTYMHMYICVYILIYSFWKWFGNDHTSWGVSNHFLKSLVLKKTAIVIPDNSCDVSLLLNCSPNTREKEKRGAAVFVWLWEWMNNFLPLEESGCVCKLVCYLAWVFYQDQTAAWALVTEDSALLSALAGMIILSVQKVEATG